VIVPVFADLGGLERCLAALDRQTWSGAYEVVVVDNGGNDALDDVVARHAHARLVVESRVGSYAARNAGIAVASGDVLAFTDADCIPDPDWVAAGVERLLEGNEDRVVAGDIRLAAPPGPRPTGVELHDRLTALRQREFAERRGFGATANLFARASAFERVGRFDAGLRSGGDVEWAGRAAAAGIDFVFEETARVAHAARSSLREFSRRKARIAGGRYVLMRREGSRTQLLRMLLASVVPPVNAMIAVGTDPRLDGFGQRVRVAAVEGYLRYLEAWEMLRLALGGTPRR
jgi:glycosyltransferase involved in cell wall biosynthesis